MKTFEQWAKEKGLELPEIHQPEGEADKAKVAENAKRTGLTHNYPDAYVRGQYPHKYFNPIKATADLDIEQQPKKVAN
jgi:hypothetical protein